MRLSIVIVNYHSLRLIRNCIRSIRQFDPALEAEIIVVDNAGDDPSALLDAYPDVQWKSMGYNAGFARANNLGIRQSSAPIVLLLNPDVLAMDDSIGKCLERFEHAGHIAASVQLLNADGSHQVTGSYFIKGGINQFLPLPFLGNFFKWLGENAGVKKTSILNTTAYAEVDWINGAFMMVKKEQIGRAGLMDEDFFLYAEEIEWCARLRKQGNICVYGDLKVTHLQGETANESFNSEGHGYYNLYDLKGRQLMLSNFVRVRKQFGIGWFLIHLGIFLFEIPVFSLGLFIQMSITRKRVYSWKQFRGFVRNLFFVIGLSGKIISNRPYFYKAL